MPGGAAGLQNWQARFKKVERELELRNKSPFLFNFSSFHIRLHFADIASSRLILGENW